MSKKYKPNWVLFKKKLKLVSILLHDCLLMLMLGVKSLISFQQGSGEEFLELQQCWISMTISRLGPHAATSLNLSELEMLDRDVLATSPVCMPCLIRSISVTSSCQCLDFYGEK